MPEKVSQSELQKCNSCASRTSDGPGLGRLSTVSHPQVCCLHMVATQDLDEWCKLRDGICEELSSDESDLFLDEGSRKRRDSFYDDSPNVYPVYGQPPTSRDASPEGCEVAPAVRGSPTKKRKIIEPRMREGFKKLTLEWRPPRFKRKIWFGTYSADEIPRARDAVTYYLRRDDPYLLGDSWQIFAERPLTGIEYQDLLPSCDQYVDKALVKGNLMGITSRDFLQPGHHAAKKDILAAYVVYGRQVKQVIHTVLGKHKKSAARKIHKDSNAQTLDMILDMMLNIDPLPLLPGEYAEEMAALSKCTAQTPQYECGYAGLPPLDEMFSLPTFPTPSFGESSTLDEDGFSATLWEKFPYD